MALLARNLRSPLSPVTGDLPSEEPSTPKRSWLILAVLAAVSFMASLDLFIVNIAIPAMSRSFGTHHLGDLSWVLNAYAIVFAALLVPAGRLADHFGRRRFLLGGVVVFSVASIGCALAPSLGVLVGCRALQAVGAAAIVPTSLGLLLPAFPKAQHTLVVGIWAGVGAIAASSGPPLGGLLVALNWRWIFLVNAPIGLATVIAGLLVLPEIRAEEGAHLPNWTSVAATFTAIALLTLATVNGSTWGWSSRGELLLWAAFAVTFGVALHRTLTHPHAVVEAALFRSRAFSAASAALILFSLGFASWLLVTVLYLQDAWGYSPLRAGLALAPGPLTAAIFAMNSSRFTRRFGTRAVAIVGPLFFAAAGVYWLVAAPAHPSYVVGFLPGLLLGGTGAGLSQAPLFATASTLPPDRATTGSAVLNMARQIGSALGVALTVVVLASAHPTGLAAFQHGWWFIATTAVAASATTAIAAPRRAVAPSAN